MKTGRNENLECACTEKPNLQNENIKLCPSSTPTKCEAPNRTNLQGKTPYNKPAQNRQPKTAE
jgi:hypothetical protein